MTYTEAIQFLYDLRLFGTKLGLETTRHLASALGDPQRRLRFIHVAGTNGKGSVCAMLESIYRQSGLKVGLFTSPHLVAFGERIQVNRVPMSEADLIGWVSRLKKTLGELKAGVQPTFFEVVTVMALAYFEAQGCDLVLWETGMGGRLDATNVVTPLASVITNVGMDHARWLGQTVAEIAREKGGIIKPGVPVLTSAAEPALAVLEDMASQAAAPMTRVDETDVARFRALNIPVSLMGDHQNWNATLACAVVRQLSDQIPVTETQRRLGLQTTVWAGRLQEVRLKSGSKVLLDGAHNAQGMVILEKALADHFQGEKPAVLLAFLAEKDWPAMCQSVASWAGKVCLAPIRSMKSASADEIAGVLHQWAPSLPVTKHGTIEEAWAHLKTSPFVVVTGSIYLVGEVMKMLDLGTAVTSQEALLNESSFPDR